MKTSMTTYSLEAMSVVAGYGTTDILKGLNLSLRSGEIYALLGANGAGKTTTLSLFLGFCKPRSGTVTVAGIDPVKDANGARKNIAYIPENVALYGHLSARENMAYFLDLSGKSAKPEEIDDALLRAGLSSQFFGISVGGFSKGMRQKVAIGLALARGVPFLLLDEPTSGLDPHAAVEFGQLLLGLREQGIATLMVTHDLLGAVEVADRIGFLDKGVIASEVSAEGEERFDVRSLHRYYTGKLA